MAENYDSTRVQLKDVRISYPVIWKAKAFGKGEGEPAFSASFIIDPESMRGQRNLYLIGEAMKTARNRRWGNNRPQIKADKLCLRGGNPDQPEQAGMMVLSSRNRKRPLVLDGDGEETVEQYGVVYAGCFVDAVVRIWAQDNDYGKRINASLEAIRFRRDGEAFGVRRITAADFDDEDDNVKEAPGRGDGPVDEEHLI